MNKQSEARLYSTVDHSKFHHKEPRRNQNGGFNSYIDIDENTKETPRIQWDECTAKFGLSDAIEGSTRRNLELSVTSKDMLKWIRGNDQNNISHVSKNSKTFFKKELSEDVLGQTLYRWSAPDHPEGKYDPLWRVKVTMSGKNKTNFFRIEEETNANGEKEKVIVPCDSSVLTPWSTVTPSPTLAACGSFRRALERPSSAPICWSSRPRRSARATLWVWACGSRRPASRPTTRQRPTPGRKCFR